MSEPQSPHPTSQQALTDARERRRMFAILALMLVAFALVVVFRRDIRVRWWEYRLTATNDLAARTHYIELLNTEPVRAAPVARRLLGNEDVALRSFGVVLALRVPGTAGEKLLAEALHDGDSSIRRGAILGFSVHHSPAVVPTLQALADDPDLEVAMCAVEGLVTAGGPEGLAALCALARTHAQVGVRAQAIGSLGDWGTAEAVPTLIECLADTAVFAGLTATEQGALDALAHVAPQLAGQAELPRDVGRTNGERAAVVLHNITQQDFGYLEAAPEARTAVIARWREWQTQQ